MRIPFLKLTRRGRGEEGQALVETALGLPVVLTLAFNVINIGYFWFMVLALAAAPRHAVQFASQGGSASGSNSAPLSSEVKTLLYENLSNAISGASESNASSQVCAAVNGVNTTTYKAGCVSYGPSHTFTDAAADPEAPVFVLQKVDVAYTVSPIIPGSAFNVVLPSNLTFHRQVTMRNLWF